MNRRTTVSICILIILTSCGQHSGDKGTDEATKATSLLEKNISNYVIARLGPDAAYKPISFGSLDTVYTPIDMDSANYYMERSQYYIGRAEDALFTSSEASQKFSDSSILFSKMALDFVNNYPKTIQGWQMEHTYSCQLSDSVLVSTSIFYLDSTFQVLSSIPKELTDL